MFLQRYENTRHYRKILLSRRFFLCTRLKFRKFKSGRRLFWIHVYMKFISSFWLLELTHLHQAFTSSTFREMKRLGFCEKQNKKAIIC